MGQSSMPPDDDRAARIAAALPFSIAQVKRILDLCEGDEELARERLTIAAETGLGVFLTQLTPPLAGIEWLRHAARTEDTDRAARLTAIRERWERATAKEWKAAQDIRDAPDRPEVWTLVDIGDAVALAIAHAPEDVPWLLAEVERLTASLEELAADIGVLHESNHELLQCVHRLSAPARSAPAIANPRVGTRVRLRDTPLGIALRADTGTITRPDERYDEHWIVRLDQAAYSIEESDLGTEIPEIVMHQDNLLAP